MNKIDARNKLDTAAHLETLSSGEDSIEIVRSIYEEVYRDATDIKIKETARKKLESGSESEKQEQSLSNKKSTSRLNEIIKEVLFSPKEVTKFNAEKPIGMEELQSLVVAYISKFHHGDAPRGISFLLHGPPGVGKTTLGRYIASRSGAYFVHLRPGIFKSSTYGSTEEITNKFFNWLRTLAPKTKLPVVLFIDEAEQFFSGIGSPSNSADMAELSIKAAFREWWDGLNQNTEGVILLAATNYADLFQESNFDRFDHVLSIKNLDLEGRFKLLGSKISDLISRDFDLTVDEELQLELAITTKDLSGRAITRAVENAGFNYEKDNIGQPIWELAESKGVPWLEAVKSAPNYRSKMEPGYLRKSIADQVKRSGLSPVAIIDLRKYWNILDVDLSTMSNTASNLENPRMAILLNEHQTQLINSDLFQALGDISVKETAGRCRVQYINLASLDNFLPKGLRYISLHNRNNTSMKPVFTT